MSYKALRSTKTDVTVLPDAPILEPPPTPKQRSSSRNLVSINVPAKFTPNEILLTSSIDIEKLALTHLCDEENEILVLVADEARNVAKTWLEKRAGKRRLRTDTLLLMQQYQANSKTISERDAMQKAETVFQYSISLYVLCF